MGGRLTIANENPFVPRKGPITVYARFTWDEFFRKIFEMEIGSQ